MMETLTVMDSGVHQEALANESLEGTTAKRMKKEPGIKGKSVTVLRGSDVRVRNGIAFMPNTIEMAQLKKREKGQFKTNVQFCSKMTEADVKKLLMATFPCLENQSFYCAAAADKRARLDFHGQPRVWDGKFIKRKIKGNSALYVLTYEQESGDGLDSKVPEQMTRKRSHDQITSPENEMSEQSLKTGTKRANTSNILTGFHLAFHESSILTGASAEWPTVLEKSEKSQQKLPEKMSPMVHSLVPVIEHVMVPDSAMQSGAIPKARISTASDQQSLSKTAAGSSNTWQAGLPLAVHKMPQEIHSVLTPDRNKLHISCQSPGQLQKVVNVEKNVLTRDQMAWTTERRGSSEVGLPVTTTPRGDTRCEPVKGAGTGFQQGSGIVLSDLLSQSTNDPGDSGFSDVEEKGASWNSADEEYNQNRLPLGMSATDHEAAVQSDSGLENTGGPSTNPNTCIQDQNYPSKAPISDWIETPPGIFPVVDEDFAQYLNTDLQEIPQIATGPRPCQIPAGPVITGAKNGISSTGVVQNPRIYPKSSGMEGGEEFVIAFPEPLAQGVTLGGALFKGVGYAPLWKYSQCDLAGIVPPSTKPGTFDVEVFDQTGNYLGTTKFSYTSRAPAPLEMVQQVLRDENLGTLFSMLAQKFGSLQGSAGQTQQQQSLQLLQLLVYTAAETDTQEFIKIAFSSAAGPIVFNSYKDKTPLPEDVARVNGHRYLAQYLQDVNTRLSKKVSSSITWLELVKALQTHVSAAQDKSIKKEKHLSESDDNLSDYFADSETSSHRSSALDDSIKFDPDSDSSIEDKKLFGPTQSLSSVDCNNFIGLKTERGSRATCGSGKCFTIHDGCGKWSLINPLLKDQQVIDGNSSVDDQETSNRSSECTTKRDGSAQGPLSSSQNMYMSRLPTILSTSEYPGDWGFEISFGPLTESPSKFATWTYSHVCKKLYVNLSSFCPIKFKTHMTPPPGTVLRAVAVFKGSTNPHDIVKRCRYHMESSNDGSAPKDQFIRSNNPGAHYHTCPESMRHSVILPYNGPQVGTEYVTEKFAFMCFSSCASGPSRRPVEVLFTLERDGQTLGRRVIEIRVCACPGRDRKSDEKAVCGEPSSSQGLGKWFRRGSGNKGSGSKRRRSRSRTSSDEDYVVTTRNRHVYELLMDFKEKLADKFEFLHLQNLDHSLVLSTSEDETEQPFSSGSPGSAFKRDSHDSLNFGGVQSDMRSFGAQFHPYVSSSQSPPSSNPQPSYSPQPPAYPQNIPASYSPTSTPASRNNSMSPVSSTPYDHCTTKSDGSAQGPSSSSQNMYMSRLPTILSTSEYPGDWGFEISFGPLTESALKSATWTYSHVCKKLYVNLSSFCPIKFKTHMTPPPGTVLRAVAVFKGSTNPHDIVKRCRYHMESSNDGSAPKDQFIRSNNPGAHYHTCPESMRHSVILPYNGPQVGTKYVTEMFAFMCLSRCASGPSRRPVEVIFTLERDGQTRGRRVIEIRVCACPGRDRKSDEKAVCGEPSSSQGLGKWFRRGSGNKGFVSISSGTSSDEDCVVTTRNRHVYEPVMDCEFEFLHLENLDNSLYNGDRKK